MVTKGEKISDALGGMAQHFAAMEENLWTATVRRYTDLPAAGNKVGHQFSYAGATGPAPKAAAPLPPEMAPNSDLQKMLSSKAPDFSGP